MTQHNASYVKYKNKYDSCNTCKIFQKSINRFIDYANNDSCEYLKYFKNYIDNSNIYISIM